MTILQSCVETDEATYFISESSDLINEEIVDLYAVSIATNTYVAENLHEFIGDSDDVYDVYENIKAFSAAHMKLAFEMDGASRESMSKRLMKGGAGIAGVGGVGYIGHKYGDNIAGYIGGHRYGDNNAAGSKAVTQAAMNNAKVEMDNVKDSATNAAKTLGNTVNGIKAKVGETASGVGSTMKHAPAAVAAKTKDGVDVVKKSLGDAKAAAGDAHDGVKDKIEASMP